MKYSFKHSIKWSIFISIVTFFLACILSVASTILMEDVTYGIGMLIVFMIIVIGVFFDVLGLASASANELPFHAMASERVKGAKQAIHIVRNADRFSNFCNDVIGDICGVMSGSAATFVVIVILTSAGNNSEFAETLVSVLFAGFVSALTVGGKAMGKSFAIHYATEIVLVIGKFFFFLEKRIGLRIFNGRRNKSNGKRGNKRASRSGEST